MKSVPQAPSDTFYKQLLRVGHDSPEKIRTAFLDAIREIGIVPSHTPIGCFIEAAETCALL
jgi:hypothetical protein